LLRPKDSIPREVENVLCRATATFPVVALVADNARRVKGKQHLRTYTHAYIIESKV
jgi:hypothetical protein